MIKYKRISSLLASAIMVLSIGGCSTKDTVSKIISRTSELETYSGTVDLEAEISSQDKTMKYGMLSDISVKTDPFFAKVNLTTKTDDPNVGGEYESQAYLTTVDGVNTAYAGYNGEWYKQIITTDDFKYSVSQYNPADNAVLFMQSATNVTNVGSEQFNGYTADKYEGTIAKGLIPDLMEATGSIALIGQNIDTTYYENTEDIKITFWVSEGVIVGYSLDLTNVVNQLFDKLNESDSSGNSSQLKAASYTCNAVLTDYNNEIDTTLPDDVLNAQLIASDTGTDSGSGSSADSGEGSAS